MQQDIEEFFAKDFHTPQGEKARFPLQITPLFVFLWHNNTFDKTNTH